MRWAWVAVLVMAAQAGAQQETSRAQGEQLAYIWLLVGLLVVIGIIGLVIAYFVIRSGVRDGMLSAQAALDEAAETKNASPE